MPPAVVMPVPVVPAPIVPVRVVFIGVRNDDASAQGGQQEHYENQSVDHVHLHVIYSLVL
jgi:hypothetical protein